MLLTVNLVGKKRWVKGKGEINVTEPTVARHYNKSMDGIDLVDRALSEMHPNKGGKNGTGRFLSILQILQMCLAGYCFSSLLTLQYHKKISGAQ